MAEKLTREALRSLQMGQTEKFSLPNAQACDSGKANAYQLQNILRCKFSIQTDYTNYTLTVTKNPL